MNDVRVMMVQVKQLIVVRAFGFMCCSLFAVFAAFAVFSAFAVFALDEVYAATTKPAVNAEGDQASSQQEAEQEYALGVEAFEKKRYAEAVDRFSRANTLRPDSRLYFNIGLAFDRAGDVSNALSNYRSYVFEERESEHTTKVTARVRELEKELAKSGVQQVTIRSKPERAQVLLDGNFVGVTPWTADLKPGFYRVALSSNGYETSRLEFSLSLEAALTLSSTLDVLRKPAGPGSAGTTEGSGPGFQSIGSPADVNRDQTDNLMDRSNVLPWIVAGTGAALGLGAVGFELDRRDAVADARSANSRTAFNANVDRMQRDQTLARVLGTVAVTGIVVGVVWLVVADEPAPQPGDQANVECLSSGCNWRVQF